MSDSHSGVRRWIQWSPTDLAGGMGGVEVHARSLARELRARGWDAGLTRSFSDLEAGWDVVQTHGSNPLPAACVKRLRSHSRPPLLVHTLHGTTLGRMAACREWLWPGGYAAYVREFLGVHRSDLVLAVRPGLHLQAVAEDFGKPVTICGNGWDREPEDAELSADLKTRLEAFDPFFTYVGRGGDPVKNTAFLTTLLEKDEWLRLLAIPGEGFPDHPRILKSGLLSGAAVLSVLRRSQGLLLCSKYEGLPLVVLEALAEGVPVVSSPAGGLVTLPQELEGLQLLKLKPALWSAALSASLRSDWRSLRVERRVKNRGLLKMWRQVAQMAAGAVEARLKNR